MMRTRPFQRGATLVEFVIVSPLVLFIILVIVQFALFGHTKAQLRYANYEAARARTAYNPENGSPDAAMNDAFQRGFLGYFGGGTTNADLQKAYTEERRNWHAIKIETEVEDDKILKVKTTFGIPENKQIPLVGPIIVSLLREFGSGSGFEGRLLAEGRIPVVSETAMHLQDRAMKKHVWQKNYDKENARTSYGNDSCSAKPEACSKTPRLIPFDEKN